MEFCEKRYSRQMARRYLQDLATLRAINPPSSEINDKARHLQSIADYWESRYRALVCTCNECDLYEVNHGRAGEKRIGLATANGGAGS